MNIQKLDYPEHIQFHPTNTCNLNCIFCWRYNKYQPCKDIPDSKLLRLVDDACNLKIKRITISGGGEPLIKAETIIKMMKIIKKKSINGVLITNGTFIPPDTAKEIIKTNWDEIQFSIESCKEKVDGFLRGKKDALKKSINGINNINDYKKKLNNKKTRLCIRTIITKYNYHHISDLIIFAHKFSVNKIYLRTVNEGECNFKGDLSVEEKDYCRFLNEIEKAKELASQHNINVEVEFNMNSLKINRPIKKVTKQNCLIPYKEIVIFGNGKASPCCNFFEYQFTDKYPNILIDTQNTNLREIWFNKFQGFRNEIMQKPNKICKMCSQDMISHESKLRKNFS